MEYLVTSEEMKAYDGAATDRVGIPSMVLMERAALAACVEVEKRFNVRGGQPAGQPVTVLILAGTGNNGGDGLALARLLAERGYLTEVIVCGDASRASGQWTAQRRILENYPVEVGSKPSREEYTILIDALFGVGLSRPVDGERAGWIEWFNRRKGFKLALDIPSGVSADDGRIMGCAAGADLTVTFGFAKRGLYLYPGRSLAGEVVTADIGIGSRCFFGREPGMFRLTESPAALLPRRSRDGNKGVFGKVLLCAGSVNMAGAAVLAARSLYRAGAGMVKVITPEENRIILQSAVPEALLGGTESLEESLKWADTAVIGPGIGRSPEARQMLNAVLDAGMGAEASSEGALPAVTDADGWKLPTVIDADGLNLLSEDCRLQQKLKERAASGRVFVLTPHMGELSRLTGKSMAELKEAPIPALRELSERLCCTVAGKDASTIICAPGKPLCLNTLGNSGMATAGSGDVLTGVIGGLLAQGMQPFQAACAGVYLHAAAGDAAAKRLGEHGVMAGDIVRELAGFAAHDGEEKGDGQI